MGTYQLLYIYGNTWLMVSTPKNMSWDDDISNIWECVPNGYIYQSLDKFYPLGRWIYQRLRRYNIYIMVYVIHIVYYNGN